MKPPTDIPTPGTPQAPVLHDYNSVKIAVVLEFPQWARDGIQWLGLDSPVFMITAAKMLEQQLSREFLPFGDLLWRGRGSDGIIRFRTPPTAFDDALRSVILFVSSYPVLERIATVASYCAAEEAWREHHRCGRQIDLQEFFKSARQEIRLADMEQLDAKLNECLAALGQPLPITP